MRGQSITNIFQLNAIQYNTDPSSKIIIELSQHLSKNEH